MKIKFLFAAFWGFCFMLVISSCVPIDVKTAYDLNEDFSKMKYYDWYHNENEHVVGDTANETCIDQCVKSAVESQLAIKGYIKNQKNKDLDFLISYHVVFKKSEKRQAVYDGGLSELDHEIRNINVKYVNYEYVQGTLILDVIDPKTKHVVWRGTVQGEHHRGCNAQDKRLHINKVIKKVLDKFPPLR